MHVPSQCIALERFPSWDVEEQMEVVREKAPRVAPQLEPLDGPFEESERAFIVGGIHSCGRAGNTATENVVHGTGVVLLTQRPRHEPRFARDAELKRCRCVTRVWQSHVWGLAPKVRSLDQAAARSGGREDEAEVRAFAEGSRHLGRAVGCSDDVLHDRQAEAGPARRARAVGTEEALEQARDVRGIDAGAVVRHLEHDRVALQPGRDAEGGPRPA